MLQVFDNFMKDPDSVRQHALSVPFIDWEGFDGEIYKRVSILEVPGLRETIEDAMGPVDMVGSGYRLNYAGELPNAAIHSDMGWGTHALVLYLGNGPSGTAFWSHRETRSNRIEPQDVELYNKIKDDWNTTEAWDMSMLIGMQFNRALIYDNTYFHSRYPFEAFGSTPDDGRLIAVAFFTPKGESHDS